jgi:hypothetical protein
MLHATLVHGFHPLARLWKMLWAKGLADIMSELEAIIQPCAEARSRTLACHQAAVVVVDRQLLK